jgi:hypothetical protein
LDFYPLFAGGFMGLGDLLDYEARIRRAVDEAIDGNLKKVPALVDDGIRKAEERATALLAQTQERLRTSSDLFFNDLDRRWERRLADEVRAQLKLLNRVLLYTLGVAALSLLYALARVKLGW